MSTLFVALLFFVMVPLGGVAMLDGSFNIARSDIELAPEIPNYSPTTIDLESAATDHKNVTFVPVSNIANPDFSPSEIESETAVRLEANKSEGFVRYNLPDSNALFTWHSYYPFLTLNIGNELTVEPSGDTFELNGRQSFDITGENYAVFRFRDSGKYLYQVQRQEDFEPGLLETAGIYLGEAVDWFAGLIAVFSKLPGFLSIALGVPLLAVTAYLLIEIIRGVG